MKTTTLLLSGLLLIEVAACHSKKKANSSETAVQAPSAPAPAPPPPPARPPVFPPMPDLGIMPPSEIDRAAVLGKFKDVTMDQLNQGHSLYTQGACVKCHGPKSIYRYSEYEWMGILDNMAFRARLSDSEKDAVVRYVYAMKATQPK